MDSHRFYKYATLNTYTLMNLINRELYFNNVSKFDDPTDSAFIIQTADKNINHEDLSQEKITQLFDLMDISFKDIEHKEGLVERVCRALERSLKKYIGIFCLTKHHLCANCGFPKLNPIMLSQYADHHKGLVIEYECHKTEVIREVVYEPSYKHFECDEILNNFNALFLPRRVGLNDVILKPLLFKFEEWKYQNEHRIFSILPGYTQLLSNFDLKISRIYFGKRVDREMAYTVQKLLKDENIEIFSLDTPVSHNTAQRIAIRNREKSNCAINCL